MYPLFQSFFSNNFDSYFNASLVDYSTDLPRFELSTYCLFCGANYTYKIPFKSINFELSNNLTIEILEDSEKLMGKYSITKINQTQGYFEFNCKSRNINNLANIILCIKDQKNGSLATFKIRRGFDGITAVEVSKFFVSNNTGLISLSFKPIGLPDSSKTYWCVVKPDIKFTDVNNNVVDVLFPKKPDIFNYALMKRHSNDFINQNEYALLNTSFKGDLTCTWKDRLSGVSIQKSISVDYTKV